MPREPFPLVLGGMKRSVPIPVDTITVEPVAGTTTPTHGKFSFTCPAPTCTIGEPCIALACPIELTQRDELSPPDVEPSLGSGQQPGGTVQFPIR